MTIAVKRAQVAKTLSASSIQRHAPWLLACVLSVLLGACAMEGRPAWEQAVLRRAPPPPVASTSRPNVKGTAAKAGLTSERTIVSSGRQKTGQTSERGSPSTTRANDANLTRAAVAPAGAAGKAVATLAPSRETSGPMQDPGWIGVETYPAQHEDTLIDLAVKHNVGFIELALANPGIDPWLPGEGTTVVIPQLHLPPEAAHRGIVLNLPEQRLYLYENGRLLRSYPVGIGRDGHATPIGTTSIVRKQANPTWYPTVSARQDDPDLPEAVPPGPDNPLGNRAMYLGWPSYLIHGTNKEYGIGRRASRGCIRMYSGDAVALYDRVAVGTPVTVVNQPIKIGWLGNDLYIEASPTISQVQQWEENGKFDPVSAGDIRRLVSKKAGGEAARIDWTAADRAVRERRGIVTRITKPLGASVLASVSDASDDSSSGFIRWLRRQFSLDPD